MPQLPPAQQEQPQPLATARPALYIDVVISNQKQVYELNVARELHAQLGAALKSLGGLPDPGAKTEDAG